MEPISKSPANFTPDKRFFPNRFGWYEVSVYVYYKNKKKDDFETLKKKLRQLFNRNSIRWNPYYLEEHEGRQTGNLVYPICKFFVNDYEQAKQLRSLQIPAAIRVQLRVTNKTMPPVRLDAGFRERLRLAILKHYKPIRESLNLINFYKDVQWKEEFFSLSEKDCMSAAIDIMHKSMPKLRSLILDNNFLKELSAFRGIEKRLPKLTYISLIFNELEDVNTLQVFEHLSLTQLDIANNPMITPIQQQRLAKLLPKLMMVDGHQLERLDETTSLEETEQTDQQMPGEESREQTPKQGLDSSVKLEKEQKQQDNKELHIQKADQTKQQQKLEPNDKMLSETQEAFQIKQQIPEAEKVLPIQVPKSITESSNQTKQKSPETGEQILTNEGLEPSVKLETIQQSIDEKSKIKNQIPEAEKEIQKQKSKIVETTQSQRQKAGQIKRQLSEPNLKLDKKLEQSITESPNQTKQKIPEPEEPKLTTQVSKVVLKSNAISQKSDEKTTSQALEADHKKRQLPVEKPRNQKSIAKMEIIPKTNKEIPSQTQEADKIKEQQQNLESNENMQSATEADKEIPKEPKPRRTKQQFPEPEEQVLPKQDPQLVPKSRKSNKVLQSNESMQSKTHEVVQIKPELPEAVPQIPELVPKRKLKSSGRVKNIPEIELSSMPTEQTQAKSLEVKPEENPIPIPVTEEKNLKTQGVNRSEQQQHSEPVTKKQKQDPEYVLRETTVLELKEKTQTQADNSDQQLSKTESLIPKKIAESSKKVEELPVSYEQADHKRQQLTVEKPKKVRKSTAKLENVPKSETSSKPVAETKTEEDNQINQQLTHPVKEHSPKQIKILDSNQERQPQKRKSLKRQLPEAGEQVPDHLLESTQSQTREENHVEAQIPKQMPKPVIRISPTKKIHPRVLNLDQIEDPQKPVDKNAQLPTPESERPFASRMMNFSLILHRIHELDGTQERHQSLTETKAQENDLQRFLNEYLRKYDYGDRRSGLKEYYQETAVVKFTSSQDAFTSCVDIIPDHLKENSYRFWDQLQIKNRDSAIAHFASLPKTLHMRPTIIADLLEVHNKRVCFAITGFVKEFYTAPEAFKIRYFMRYFVLTSLPGTDDDPNFRIASEVVYIRDASREQLLAGVIPKSTESQSGFMRDILKPLLPDIVCHRRFEQDKLTHRLCKQTQIKWEWCRKCLSEYYWDFDASLARFKEMHEKHLIPKTAYQSSYHISINISFA